MASSIEVVTVGSRAGPAARAAAALARTRVAGNGVVDPRRLCTSRAELSACLERPVDLILADDTLPQLPPPDALQLLRERGLDVPVIVVADTARLADAVDLLKCGACDYFGPDDLARLPAAVEQAMHDCQIRRERRAADQRLRESEQRSAAFMEHMPGVMFLKDAAGRYVYVNAAWEKTFQKDQAQWWGRTNEQLFAPATAFQMSHHDRLVREANTPLQTIETIEHEGSLRHYLVVKFPIQNGTYVGGAAVDVTDRIRAEESLREQIRLARLSGDVGLALTKGQALHDMLKACADSMLRHVGAAGVRVWTHRPAQGVLELAASAGLRCRPDEQVVAVAEAPVGKAVQDRALVQTNDLLRDPRWADADWVQRESLVALACLPLLVDERVVGVLALYARKALSAATLDALRGVANQIAVGIDRKQNEDALRGSEERYRRIIETTAEGIWTLDADDRTTFVNQNMARMMGHSASAMVGQPLLSLLQERDRPRAEVQLERLRQGIEEQFDFKVHHRDGRMIWLMVSTAPLYGADHRYAGALIMCSDISERKRLEEQYRQAQKMEAIGRLAGGVAHDFNNLITIVNGCADLVLAKLPGDDPAAEFVREIKNAGERGAGLTRQLLAFSRQQVLEPRVVDLNAVITDMERMLGRMIGEDIVLGKALDPRLGRVRVDPGQIHQIIMNLAVNARDAMPNGGQFTIETRNVDLDEDYARLHSDVRPGGYVMLVVSDTGVGMDSDIRTRVFEPFFTTKEPGKGTGLGLATVYGIVTQSGGHISLYSEPRQGTVFKIFLPRVDEPLSNAAAHPAAPKALRGAETVLLVEDEDTVRLLSRHILELYGYTVLEARGPEEALAMAEHYEGSIHLLLTDVVMPGGGGRLVAEQLSASRPGVKVLYVSGYTDDAVVRYGVLHAEAAFLQKPFTAVSLAAKVREVLDGVPVASS
jgi:two-component system, cell cycle sensor histidine kinase and response regulator CckA